MRKTPRNWRECNYRINAFECPDGHITSTVDVDEGATPALIKCRHFRCNLTARSLHYPTDRPIPECIPAPRWEWYRPDEKEFALLSEYMKARVHKGFLLLRKRTDKQPLEMEIPEGITVCLPYI